MLNGLNGLNGLNRAVLYIDKDTDYEKRKHDCQEMANKTNCVILTEIHDFDMLYNINTDLHDYIII